jgi:DegV family protein with EDD domain
MGVAIVTDSTCDLPAERAAELGVTVVPLTIFFGDEAILDGPNLDIDTFYARLRSFSGLPRTSQPSVEQFRAAYEQAAAGGNEVVSIHISSKMSGTLNSASIAREDLSDGIHIDLIDSYNVSLGLGAVVVEAAEAARAGASREQVAEAARQAVARVHVVAALDTLEYLRRGGRIGRARSLLGALLNIKPILHVDGGEMAPLERVRTRAKAMDRLVELATADPRISRLYVAAGGDPSAVDELVERVTPRLPHTEVVRGRIGPVVGVHAGPGVFGFCTVARLT